MSRVVHVAVGVIVGRHEGSAEEQGAILIAKRPAKTHQGGLWEFPGGKVESGEKLFDALKRELKEELAIDITATEPLIKIRHDYGDKAVLLDVHRVTHFYGEPRGNEGQPIMWVAPSCLHEYEFPAANRPIVTAINLPQRLLITGDFINRQDFLARIELALQRNIRMVQLRLKNPEMMSELVGPAAELCDRYSAKLMLNTSPQLFSEYFVSSAVGLHLNSAQLSNCHHRPVSNSILLGASCHTQNDILHAQTIGVDYICLSPVRATNSHPGQVGIGWDRFSSLVERSTIPVYALGGMTEVDLTVALENGAQGIAAISEWWN